MFVYNACAADPRVLKEARSLAVAGYRVRVFAVLAEGLPEREQRDGFEIIRIERRPLHYRAIQRARDITGRPAGKPGAVAPTTEPGPLRRAAWAVLRRIVRAVHRPLMMLDYYTRAFRLVRADPATVLHSHDLLTLPVGVALKLATRAPLVYDAHELYPEVSTLSSRQRRAWAWIERRLIGRADVLVTVCQSIADELVRRYGVARPEVVLNCPPAARPPEAVGREALGAGDRAGPIVLYTGGLAPHRGLETLVRSARGIKSGVIVLLGAGRLRPELQRLIAAEEVEDRVVLLDAVAPEAVPEHTAAADIGVIPYEPVGLNNRYTTPNKLFDYLAAGLPVVASRLPELERFVREPRRGLLFEPGDAASLADAVNRIADDAELRNRMAGESRAAGEELTWESQEQVLLGVYRSIEDSNSSWRSA